MSSKNRKESPNINLDAELEALDGSIEDREETQAPDLNMNKSPSDEALKARIAELSKENSILKMRQGNARHPRPKPGYRRVDREGASGDCAFFKEDIGVDVEAVNRQRKEKMLDNVATPMPGARI